MDRSGGKLLSSGPSLRRRSVMSDVGPTRMNARQLHIKSKPFLLWSIGIFVLCLLPVLALFGSEALLGESGRSTLITSFSVCAVVSVAGAFVVSALTQTFRGIRSGEFVFADLLAPATITMIIGTFLLLGILAYAFSPAVPWAAELCLWAVCLVVWIVDAVRRVIKNRRKGGTIPTSKSSAPRMARRDVHGSG